MTGFATVAEYARADDLGQCWVTQFRKTVPSAATTTGEESDDDAAIVAMLIAELA